MVLILESLDSTSFEGVAPSYATKLLYLKSNARQPPAFPEPRAPVLSAGSLFTVVFGMGTGVSYCRITTGQYFFDLFNCFRSHLRSLQTLRVRRLRVCLLIADTVS